MTLTTSPHPDLPQLRFPADLRLTHDQFELLCAENRDAVLELSSSCTPSAQRSGRRSIATGFQLPDGSVVSPDASLVRLDRWEALSAEERRRFAPVCPELVVELASPSDEGPRGLSALRQKMADYQRNGARLGWLLLPEERAVEVWPSAGEPQLLEQIEVLEARPECPGLQLQLAEIWAG